MQILRVKYSEDSGTLYAAGSGGRLYAIDAATAVATVVGNFGNVTCDDLLYSNNAVYALTTAGTLLKYDLTTHVTTTFVTGMPADMYGIGRYSDGAVYAIEGDGDVYTIDLTQGILPLKQVSH
jgi:hypothetical protein